MSEQNWEVEYLHLTNLCQSKVEKHSIAEFIKEIINRLNDGAILDVYQYSWLCALRLGNRDLNDEMQIYSFRQYGRGANDEFALVIFKKTQKEKI